MHDLREWFLRSCRFAFFVLALSAPNIDGIYAAEDGPAVESKMKIVNFAVLAEKKMSKDFQSLTLHEAMNKILADLGIGHNISLAVEMESEEDTLFSMLHVDITKDSSVRAVLDAIAKVSDCAYLYDEEEGVISFKLNSKPPRR